MVTVREGDRDLDDIPGVRDWRIAAERSAESGVIAGANRLRGYWSGVLASTGVDAHGDQPSLKALERTAAKINDQGLPITVNHDPLIQPLGRAFAARVFEDSVGGEHLLVVVMGICATGTMPSTTAKSVEATEEQQPLGPNSVRVALDPRQFPDRLLDDLLEGAPAVVSEQPEVVVRKALEPLLILTVIVSGALFSSKYFFESFAKKLGDKAADEVIALYDWLKSKVVGRFSELEREARLVIESEYGGCRIRFVLATRRKDVLREAVDHLPQGCSIAAGFVNEMANTGVQSLVLTWDEGEHIWKCLHALTTEAGILSSAAVVVDFDSLRALSIEATILEASLRTHERDGD